jgi:hypothetical protein
MALSKWFLCGAEGCFEMDEELAFTFAEKAAKKNLPSAVFAIAYYHEVGIGGRKDLAAAQKWYEKVRIPFIAPRVKHEGQSDSSVALAGFDPGRRRCKGSRQGTARRSRIRQRLFIPR